MRLGYKLMIIGLCILGACQKDDPVFYDNSLTMHDVKLLGIRADHDMMLGDSLTEMNLRAVAFGIKELPQYLNEVITFPDDPLKQDTTLYYDLVKCDTFEIPKDLYPSDWIKIYDENDQELKDGIFTTQDTTQRTVYFYAKAGELTSAKFPLKIRTLPKNKYEEVVFPVIFHVVTQAGATSGGTAVTTQGLQERIERLNNIFNRRITKNPNGGDVKISFKLAEYNPSGAQLATPGINRITLTQSYSEQKDLEANLFTSCLWNPRQYLNVWLVKPLRDNQGLSIGSYTANAPNVYVSPYAPIPGLKMTVVDPEAWQPADIYEAGVLVSYKVFFNPTIESEDQFEFATVMGTYLGLLKMEINGLGSNMVNGDTDYCPDTYYFQGGQTLYKNNFWTKHTGEVKYYTSFNIMESYSTKNSITVDQATRLRQVIERCPSRWSYRSNWAFTGKK